MWMSHKDIIFPLLLIKKQNNGLSAPPWSRDSRIFLWSASLVPET